MNLDYLRNSYYLLLIDAKRKGDKEKDKDKDKGKGKVIAYKFNVVYQRAYAYVKKWLCNHCSYSCRLVWSMPTRKADVVTDIN